jgi:hypothetical protein
MTEQSVAIGVQEPLRNLVIVGDDDRELLNIYMDGRVTGSVEDAGEAGQRFVAYVRRVLGHPPVTDEQVEAAAVALYTLEYGAPEGDDFRESVDFEINLTNARLVLEAAFRS